MMLLDTMHLEAELLVYCELHEQHWRKQGEHHGRRRCGGRPFVAWQLLVVLTEIESDLDPS